MNRKLRPQTVLAPLTKTERQSLANLLVDGFDSAHPGNTGKYAEVLELCCKPRSEGGYGLKISVGPLQTLRKREIARRMCNKGSPEPLDLDQFLEIMNGGEPPETRIGQYFLQRNACHLAQLNEDLTPRDLLFIGRVLSIPLEQKRIRHRMSIESRRCAALERRNRLAERKIEQSVSRPCSNAGPSPLPSRSAPSALPRETYSSGSTSALDPRPSPLPSPSPGWQFTVSSSHLESSAPPPEVFQPSANLPNLGFGVFGTCRLATLVGPWTSTQLVDLRLFKANQTPLANLLVDGFNSAHSSNTGTSAEVFELLCKSQSEAGSCRDTSFGVRTVKQFASAQNEPLAFGDNPSPGSSGESPANRLAQTGENAYAVGRVGPASQRLGGLASDVEKGTAQHAKT